VKDERRVKLYQCRARLDLGESRLGAIDSADADQGELPLNAKIGFGQHMRRKREERLAGEAARL